MIGANGFLGLCQSLLGLCKLLPTTVNSSFISHYKHFLFPYNEILNTAIAKTYQHLIIVFRAPSGNSCSVYNPHNAFKVFFG